MTEYRWTSIEFEDDLPAVCLENGDESAKLVFGSLEELKELVNTLKGAINAEERDRGARCPECGFRVVMRRPRMSKQR
jgi:DNA-directed RNA polymerase subunit RPC12/RpoP